MSRVNTWPPKAHAVPLFTVVPVTRPSLRFLVFGDLADDTTAEAPMVHAMGAYGQTHPYALAITTGNNFAFGSDHRELQGPTDPRWKAMWEDRVGLLKVPIYPALGGSDWGPGSLPAELSYASPTWHMPAQYYTFVAGPVQFFAINDLSPDDVAQQTWLKAALRASTARWKVMYGARPLYYPSDTTGRANSALAQIVQPYGVVYLSGEPKVLAHYNPPHRFPTLVSGGAAGPDPTWTAEDPRAPQPTTPGVAYLSREGGFLVAEATGMHLTITFVKPDGTEVYTHTFTK